MGGIGAVEILVVVLIVVILFGAKRLPEMAKSIAKAIKEFRKASNDEEEK